MRRDSCNTSSVTSSEATHRCGLLCLGPLTFHRQAVGDMVRLSQGGRLAEKTKNTFRNGLVFSSRTVKTQERIRLRVERDSFNWNGALRVGFTNVSPSSRSLPLPSMAIPDLTNRPGHWAAAVPESFCPAGTELEFWVSSSGSMYISNNSSQGKLLTGVDLSQPLWAMIDIYGQTSSILLLGSKIKGFCTRRSCPAPEPITSPDVSSLSGSTDDCISCLDMEISADKVCVVCMGREASVLLPCGHQCLCLRCSSRVCQQFGTCPLCRHKISSTGSEEV
ncbi:E3 ubiquitin-protein ligase NEURL3-like [Acanthochromis polyacanthus]|uniref:E3 ubiquitin-protein ligase NEURL3-like n=1 Tax=Acanthochromis polyacanthus TaxID=80966 RepID=UPI0022343F6B|nr:E3 ubiquitin-protein ligase NEURL3-like [Acanthochromis polyacanthus]